MYVGLCDIANLNICACCYQFTCMSPFLLYPMRSLPRLDEHTNVLVYLTGHGGDNFFKFQDGEELMSNDVASAFSQMYELKRYNEILFISDTCQAFTMADEIEVPNVFSVGSSLRG